MDVAAAWRLRTLLREDIPSAKLAWLDFLTSLVYLGGFLSVHSFKLSLSLLLFEGQLLGSMLETFLEPQANKVLVDQKNHAPLEDRQIAHI